MNEKTAKSLLEAFLQSGRDFPRLQNADYVKSYQKLSDMCMPHTDVHSVCDLYVNTFLRSYFSGRYCHIDASTWDRLAQITTTDLWVSNTVAMVEILVSKGAVADVPAVAEKVSLLLKQKSLSQLRNQIWITALRGMTEITDSRDSWALIAATLLQAHSIQELPDGVQKSFRLYLTNAAAPHDTTFFELALRTVLCLASGTQVSAISKEVFECGHVSSIMCLARATKQKLMNVPHIDSAEKQLHNWLRDPNAHEFIATLMASELVSGIARFDACQYLLRQREYDLLKKCLDNTSDAQRFATSELLSSDLVRLFFATSNQDLLHLIKTVLNGNLSLTIWQSVIGELMTAISTDVAKPHVITVLLDSLPSVSLNVAELFLKDVTAVETSLSAYYHLADVIAVEDVDRYLYITTGIQSNLKMGALEPTHLINRGLCVVSLLRHMPLLELSQQSNWLSTNSELLSRLVAFGVGCRDTVLLDDTSTTWCSENTLHEMFNAVKWIFEATTPFWNNELISGRHSTRLDRAVEWEVLAVTDSSLPSTISLNCASKAPNTGHLEDVSLCIHLARHGDTAKVEKVEELLTDLGKKPAGDHPILQARLAKLLLTHYPKYASKLCIQRLRELASSRWDPQSTVFHILCLFRSVSVGVLNGDIEKESDWDEIHANYGLILRDLFLTSSGCKHELVTDLISSLVIDHVPLEFFCTYVEELFAHLHSEVQVYQNTAFVLLCRVMETNLGDLGAEQRSQKDWSLLELIGSIGGLTQIDDSKSSIRGYFLSWRTLFFFLDLNNEADVRAQWNACIHSHALLDTFVQVVAPFMFDISPEGDLVDEKLTASIDRLEELAHLTYFGALKRLPQAMQAAFAKLNAKQASQLER